MYQKQVLGMVGFGGIGRVHLLAYRDIPLFYPDVLPEVEYRAVCLSTAARGMAAARQWGFRDGYGDFDQMLNDDDITVIDCVSPNYLHREQIIKALEAGKDVLCEKPLALTGKEALEIAAAAEKTGRQVGMIFNYRFIPAVQQARQWIREGRLGDVYSFRGSYFHTGYQNPQKPFSWRMDKKKSGGGALVDLGVHVLDLLMFLLGDIHSVDARMQTFIKERPSSSDPTQMIPVTVDDAAWMTLKLQGGAIGSLEVSRFATGSLDDLQITAMGTKGAFRIDLMDANFLYWYDQDDSGRGWQRVETVQKYAGTDFPVPRSIMGWTRFHAENQFQFLKAISEKKEFKPDVRDGLKVQMVLDAAYRSAASGRQEEI